VKGAFALRYRHHTRNLPNQKAAELGRKLIAANLEQPSKAEVETLRRKMPIDRRTE
jgi:hypothetical protein